MPKHVLTDTTGGYTKPIPDILSIIKDSYRDLRRSERRVADVVVFMHQGKVWETGPTTDVFANPRTAEFKQFVGSEL